MKQQEDEQLFRLLGPVNSDNDFNIFDENNLCHRYGGCRMFLCGCHNRMGAEGEMKEEDWFKGACDYCNKRIRNVAHCIRRPLPMGSWTGVYCCSDHVIKDMTEPDPTLVPMLTVVEDQLLKYGVQDRK